MKPLLIPIGGLVNVVAAGARYLLEVDALAKELLMIRRYVSVAIGTGLELMAAVGDRIGLDVHGMAGGTGDPIDVVRAACKLDDGGFAGRLGVTGQASVDLSAPWRGVFDIPEIRQPGEASSAVRA